MEFQISPRQPLSLSYTINNNNGQPIITRLPSAQHLDSAGVYLIFDRRVKVEGQSNSLNDLIYVGLAGAIGMNSTFDARIPKHIKKSLGFHADHPDFPQAGISDTVLWAKYRDQHLPSSFDENVESVLANWDLQLIVISNRSDAERKFIGLMEKVVGLVYAASKSDFEGALLQPPCNSTDLIKPILKLFGTEAPRSVAKVAVKTQPDQEQKGAQDLDILARDNDTLDPEFFARMSEEARQIYASYVALAQVLFQQSELLPYGLSLHYTNTNPRSMLVSGVFPKFPQQKNCMRVVWRLNLNSLDVYSRLDENVVRNLAAVKGVEVQVSEVSDNLHTLTRISVGRGDVPALIVEMTKLGGGFI